MDLSRKKFYYISKSMKIISCTRTLLGPDRPVRPTGQTARLLPDRLQRQTGQTAREPWSDRSVQSDANFGRQTLFDCHMLVEANQF